MRRRGALRSGASSYLVVARELARLDRARVPWTLARATLVKALFGLSANEYAMFNLDRQPLARIRDFRTKKQTTALLARLNDSRAAPLVEDKLAFHRICAAAGLAQPELHALVCAAPPVDAGGYPVLLGVDALMAHFATRAPVRLILKPRRDALGTGVRYVALREGGAFDIDDRPIDMQRFASELASDMARDDYLVQAFASPHPQVARLGSGKALGTLRVVTWLGPDGPRILYTLLRIPAAGNAHDNFSGGASGNLIAGVDASTGVLGPAFGRRGPAGQRSLQVFPCNPDTGAPIEGQELPLWAALRSMALTAVPLFPRLALLGWDFAITDRGVIVIEANSNPDIIGAQATLGRGAADLLRPALAVAGVA